MFACIQRSAGVPLLKTCVHTLVCTNRNRIHLTPFTFNMRDRGFFKAIITEYNIRIYEMHTGLLKIKYNLLRKVSIQGLDLDR